MKTAIRHTTILNTLLMGGASVLVMGLAGVAHAQTAPAPAAPANDAQVEEVVVTGMRASLRSAADIKQNSSEFVDSIVAADIGKLPDANVADSLQRIPGIQLYRFAGEGLYASLRGLLDQNRTEYNGRSYFTPDAPVGGGRDFEPDNALSELIAGMDVYKNPSAERIEGAIGGLVNIRTYRPFDFKGFKAIASVKGTYYDLAYTLKPSLFGMVSNRWDTGIGEIGVLVGAGHQKTAMRQDSFGTSNNNFTARPYLSYGNDLNGNGVVNTAAAPSADVGDYVMAPNGFNEQMIYGGRERTGLNVAVQWRPNDRVELYADGNYTEYSYNQYSYNIASSLAASSLAVTNLKATPYDTVITAADVAAGSTLAVGTKVAGYNFQSATFSNAGFTGLGDISIDHPTQYQVATGGRWDVTDRLEVSGEIAYSHADQEKIYRSLNLQTAPVGTYTITQDLTQNQQSILVTGGTATLADSANWYFSSYNKQYTDITLGETAARLDAKYDFGRDGFLRTVKVGVRATDLAYTYDKGNVTWTIRDAAGTGNANLIKVNTTSLGTNAFSEYFRNATRGVAGFVSVDAKTLLNDSGVTSALPTAYRIVNGVRVNGIASGDPAYDPGLSFELDEKTYAGYAVADWGASLMGMEVEGNAGVRIARTEGETRGYQTAPKGYGYTDVLPSANAKLHINDEWLVRVGASKGVTRPGFPKLNPSINTQTSGITLGGTPVATIGNPDLKPQKSNNFDVALEYYFQQGLLGSGNAYVSGFYKDISGFIINYQSLENLGFTDVNGNVVQTLVTRPINGAGGKIKGIEAGFQTFFDFLPAPYDGLGVQANYTYVDGTQQVPLGSAASPVFITQQLPFLSKHSANIVGMYEKGGLTGRIAYNWRGDYLRNQFGGGLPNLATVTPAFGTLDGSISYDFNDVTTLTAEVSNVLNTAPDRYADGIDLRPVQQYTYDRRFALALRFKFGG